jgi:O-antigen ligase
LFLVALLALVAWAITTSLWSPYPDRSQALKLLVLVPLGLVFTASASRPEAARLTISAAIASFAVLAGLLSIEAIWGFPLGRAAQPDAPLTDIMRNPARGAVVLLSLLWACAAGLLAMGWRIAAALAVVVTGFLSFQFEQLANLVAFSAGLLAFALAFAAPRLSILLVSGALSAWMLAAPFLTPLMLSNQSLIDAMPLSWAARAGIWNYACARIVESPWVGHGLDASRAVADRIAVRDLDMRGIPLHPHSASLHIWYETGLVGAALAAALIMLGGVALARNADSDRRTSAAIAAALASLGLIAYVSYGVWQEWWIATMFVAAAASGALRAAKA